MTRDELVARWVAQREAFRRTQAVVDGASLADLFVADLGDLEQTAETVVLTLDEAAKRSGYSVEHLGRLIRQGVVSNAGRKGAPRIYARDIPARRFARTRKVSYDVNADARTLKNERQ